MIYVFFHKNCMDGAGARYAAFCEFGDTAIYQEVQYGDPFPEYDYQKEDEIYILDFSFSREVLIEMSNVCKLKVIDHHDTAMTALEGLDFAIFDMTKSGAVMAWQYFHPNVQVPYIFRLLQDYDLWNWELEETLNFTSRFQSDVKRLEPEYFQQLMTSCEAYYARHYFPFSADENQLLAQSELFESYLELGGEAASAMKKEMDSLINKKKYTIKNIDGKNVVVFNTTMYFSMLGHVACGIENVDYSMSYFVKECGGVVFSFRSKKGGHDVGKVASTYGGGGHKSASGANIPFPKSLEVLRNIYEMDSVY